ncbi:MAG: toprim domain-containing protein [Ilumatobacteraceae bacterium]
MLVHCHAGCATPDVVKAAGLTMLDLAPPRPTSSSSDLVASYPYVDEHGTLLYEVLRFVGKQFRQRPANGRTGAGAMDGVRRVLYRLPAVLSAVERNVTVFIVEGEKDADRLTREGYCATTAAQGAGKWHTVADHARQVLAGADVVIVADRDEPGRRHAEQVAKSLDGAAASVVIVEAAEGKDASDHLDAGHTVEQLVRVDHEPREPRHDEHLDDLGHLPASFWNARPVLDQIRQAAWSRGRSPDAVLGAVLARVAALTPPQYVIPPIVGSSSTLATYVALVAPSGVGKSTSKAIACELIRCDDELDVADDLSLGSGEGLVEAYFTMVEEANPTGKGTRKVKRRTRRSLFLFLDEGQALAGLGGRQGSTLLENLRSAWRGETIGQANASIETNRRLQAGTYTLGLVVGFQPQMASSLLADATGGTPQRFLWLQATSPDIPDDPTPWPGRIDWQPPMSPAYQGVPITNPLDVDDVIRQAVIRDDRERNRGTATVDDLDGHANLVRLKIAGLLAILDNRTNIDLDDWTLAGTITRTSRAVRTDLLRLVAIEARQREDAITDKLIRRDAAIGDDQVSRATYRMAKAIAKKVHKAQGCTRRDAQQATASGDRKHATIDDAIDRAIELQWIVLDADHLTPGKAAPL